VNASGVLAIRSDVSGVTRTSTTMLGTGWHQLEMCGSVGAATAWTVYRDGVAIISNWVTGTGTTPIGRINVGDTTAKTWVANFDSVVLDRAPG
jgi:hypothetical protein